MLRHHEFVHYNQAVTLAALGASILRGNAMRLVPMPERDRAKLEHQIDNLKVLVSRSGANSRDLQTTGEHVPAALETLDPHGRIEVEREAVPVVRCAEWTSLAEWAALDAAILQAATALQEAIASVDLMRLRAGATPCLSDLQDLADRLACADAAFRIVAVGTLKTLARKLA